MKAWIYLLHFDEPLSHAKHYLGCTVDLLTRLTTHANGDGANICRELIHRGIEWHLAAIWRTSSVEMRGIERKAKDRHNGPQFCPECGGTARPGGTPFDLSLIPFTPTSLALRCKRPGHRIRQAEQADQEQIRVIMKQHNEVLGFIPVKGTGGFTLAIDAQHVAVVEQAGEILAYIIWTATKTSCTIQQVAVHSGYQQTGLGTALVQYVEAKEAGKQFQCNVRDDLPANEFWRHLQYQPCGYHTHRTSGNKLNHYEKEPIQ